MADLRGEQLKDSYQNVVTRGTGNKLENGNGVEFADLDDKASLSMFPDPVTIDLSNDDNFSAGTLVLERLGNIVHMTIFGNITHSSTDSVTTDSAVIPSDWRPTDEAGRNVYFGFEDQAEVTVGTDGTVRFRYSDDNGPTARTSTPSGGVTYRSILS